MNQAGTIYSKNNLPTATVDVTKLKTRDHVRTGQYTDDKTEYLVLSIGRSKKLEPDILLKGKMDDIPAGKWLIRDDGSFAYFVDPAINGSLKTADDGTDMKGNKFEAPKTQLVALIINGVFDRDLPWGLVIIGVLIAIVLELSGVPSLPFAVGVYLPLASSVPIFVGGAMRLLADKLRGTKADDSDSSPGVLLASGLIAGGSIMAVIYAFMQFEPSIPKSLNFAKSVGELATSEIFAVSMFGLLCVILLIVGSERFVRKPAD
jgi:hypothetical protein